ncbi:MAG: hypothetical protein K0U64_09500 [Actinomycetia bacterium]|nr:hypothetical protein [Actinomycetes bacterium]
MSAPTCIEDEEAGSLSLLMIVLSVVLLGAIGLVVDGGAKIRGTQMADAVAAEAARAGGQQIIAAEAMAQGRVRLDPGLARNKARDYLRLTGFDGDVSVSQSGQLVRVTTRDTVKPVFLGLLGIHSMEVSGYAEATLVHRVGAP